MHQEHKPHISRAKKRAGERAKRKTATAHPSAAGSSDRAIVTTTPIRKTSDAKKSKVEATSAAVFKRAADSAAEPPFRARLAAMARSSRRGRVIVKAAQTITPKAVKRVSSSDGSYEGVGNFMAVSLCPFLCRNSLKAQLAQLNPA